MKWILPLTFFLGLESSWAGEVIPFRSKPKSCSNLLSPGRSAKILTFETRDPSYLDSQSFIKNLKEGEEGVFYLYSNDPPQFSYRSSGVWRAFPKVNAQDHLYIVKVRAFDEVFFSEFERREHWTAGDLRAFVRMETFTRVRVSPFFGVVENIIQQIRGFESYHTNTTYDAVSLHPETSVLESSLKIGLINYINNWQVKTYREEVLKEYMKDYIHQHIGRTEEKKALRRFVELMDQQIRATYDFVKSVPQ